MKESEFQHNLLVKLKIRFPGCVVMKNDANYKQGFPDLLVLYKDRWACLECKRSANAPRRPNQDYYIRTLGEMSYASFISPDTEEEVLNELERTFGVRG